MTASGRKELRRIFHDGRVRWGEVEGDMIVLPDGARVPCASAQHLAPCDPRTIICIHLNYDARRVEFRAPAPEKQPTYFQKPLTTLNGHGGLLYRPRGCRYLNYEGEIAVVIGRDLRRASRDEAWDSIAGYAPANDVGCHDFRGTDRGSMLRVKGMDGFCPVGPGLVSGIDIRQSKLRTYINGRVVQGASSTDMSFDIGYIIADLTRHITLQRGDLILTGTPANSRPMDIGDVIEVEVTGVGRLKNTVAEALADDQPIGFPPTVNDEASQVALGGDYFVDKRSSAA